MVVLTIIVTISMAVLTSQSAFNKTLILANTAYDVALTLRLTETYGLGNSAFGTNVNTGYGLHFAGGAAPNNSSFILFADIFPSVESGSLSLCHTPPAYDPKGPSAQPGNCVYDGAAELKQTYKLNNGITINKFCALTGGSVWYCTTTAGANKLLSLDIVFSRPNPTAFIRTTPSFDAITKACITLTSKQGNFKHISITQSGQISANAVGCPR
jgi:hypothetical protein